MALVSEPMRGAADPPTCAGPCRLRDDETASSLGADSAFAQRSTLEPAVWLAILVGGLLVARGPFASREHREAAGTGPQSDYICRCEL